MNGEKYSQIFIDVVSKRVWVVRLKKKRDSDDAIRLVINDAKARSRNNIRILRTDGDGIFGRSATFLELKAKENFVHERPAPYDHQQSAIVDRESQHSTRAARHPVSGGMLPHTLFSHATSYRE